jgi:hypothetical protein
MACCPIFHRIFGDGNKIKPYLAFFAGRNKSQRKQYVDAIPTVSEQVSNNGIEEKVGIVSYSSKGEQKNQISSKKSNFIQKIKFWPKNRILTKNQILIKKIDF